MTPPRLYKYGSFEGDRTAFLKEVLLEDKIFFSNPFHFNDPFDCRPRLEIGTSRADRENAKEEIFQMITEKYPHAPKLTRRKEAGRILGRIEKNNSLTDQYEHLLKSAGVYCLSAKPQDLLMWAHYGASHAGYCLEFNAEEGTFFSNASEVYYQAEYPVIKLFHSDPERGKKAILTKSPDWAYEEEWRLTSKKHGHMEFKGKELTGILFGCKATQDSINMVSEWLNMRRHRVRTLRALMNNKYYRLDLVEIK